MKVIAISDTHNYNEKIAIPMSDLLIHCGDLTSMGHISEVTRSLDWLAELPNSHKVLIAGNHDFYAMDDPDAFRRLCHERNIHYLYNSGVRINTLSIWGSPYTPTFGQWAFMRTDEKLFEIFSKIPNNLDILITHGPPKGILDEVRRGSFVENTGSLALLECVNKTKPKVHVFGHIHEQGGNQIRKDGTTFINAATLNESYVPWDKQCVEFQCY